MAAVVALVVIVHPAGAQDVPIGEGEGWYFVEKIVRIPFDGNSADVGNEALGQLIEVDAPCPAGYDATACMASTVPAAIANWDATGGIEPGPGLLRTPDDQIPTDALTQTSGYNYFVGCSYTFRVNTVRFVTLCGRHFAPVMQRVDRRKKNI